MLLRQNIFWRFVLGLLIAFTIGILTGKYRTNNISKNNNIIIFKDDKCLTTTISGIIESIRPTERGIQIILSEIKFIL